MANTPVACEAPIHQVIRQRVEQVRSSKTHRARGPATLTGLVLLAAACSGPALSGDSVHELADHLDTSIPDAMEAAGVPGLSIALIDGGELVWSNAYGWADVASQTPMTVKTVNRAESISKPVTAVGVLSLIEQGSVRLDDRLVDHIDRWAFPEDATLARGITVRQLLSHTAGVAPGPVGVHYTLDGDMPSLDENLTREFHLTQPPGSAFLYSNVGFNLLEVLIEEVTGEDFADHMQQQVLDPAGMVSASFAWNDELTTAVPVGYDLMGEPVPVYLYPEKASGGLFASVEDIARFVIAGQAGSDQRAPTAALEQSTLEQMYTPHADIGGLFGLTAEACGLGHFIEQTSDGRRAIWHGGQGHGWMTDFHSIPDDGDGIVIMANSQRSWPMIGQILADWSEWNDVEPVGFSIVARVSAASRVAIAVFALVTTSLLWRLATGIKSGRRRPTPWAKETMIPRLGRGLIGLALIAAVAWDMAKEYSFYSSILPGTLGWLRASVIALGLTLFIAAMIPVTQETRGPVTQRPHR